MAVSGWRLARTVSSLGALGVVSGTALDAVGVEPANLTSGVGVLEIARFLGERRGYHASDVVASVTRDVVALQPDWRARRAPSAART